MCRGLLLLALVLTVAFGCGPTRQRLDVVLDTPPEVALSHEPPTPVPHTAPFTGRKPTTILALSGGGSYGAFTAGLMNGWTRTEQRPDFDVVTGISTGALIAPMAFLGPNFDDEMRRFYTEVTQKDIFAVRYWATIPFRDSAATSAPLRRLVEGGLTDAVVAQLAVEHQKGRRLYIGTTQLETRRTVVWDIGAIACHGGDDARRLIADVMVASCTLPGVFPPVPIRVEEGGRQRVEQHVDGGVTAAVFVPPEVLDAAGGADLYVVVAGKHYPDPSRVRLWVPRVLTASGGALLSAHTRRDVANLYHMARLAGVKFHVAAVPASFQADESSIAFDATAMRALFLEGLKAGHAGPAWQSAPPERRPGEAGGIRTGTRLRTGS